MIIFDSKGIYSKPKITMLQAANDNHLPPTVLFNRLGLAFIIIGGVYIAYTLL